MKTNNLLAIILAIIIMTSLYFIGFFLGFGVGKKTGERDLILEAVRNGAGRWGGDKKGRAEFQWITNSLTLNEE